MHKTWTRWQTRRRQPATRLVAVTMLLVLLFIATLYGISTGAVDISAGTIRDVTLDEVMGPLGYHSDLDYDDRLIARNATLILDIRWPRVILGGLAGAGLAMAGAGLQGVFRNPLADPGLIGISSGASVGAVIAVLAGGGQSAQAGGAFALGLLTTFLVYVLAYQQRRTDSTTLLLIGLAVNAIAASFVGMATFIAGPEEVGDIIFWTLGSVVGAFWRDVLLLLPFIILGIITFPLLANQLNLMALGESEARHLGVHVERLRVIVLTLSALIVGISVSVMGIIGFVGLVVPHFLRLLFGPDHRLLLPASFLGGATFLIAADLFARTVALPSEVPIGVVTTLVGGPFFLFLILLYRQGGLGLDA